MFNEKAQSAVEIIIIAVVLVGLLLATAIIMVQRNIDANRLISLHKDTQICENIAETITNLALNRDYTEIKIQQLEKKAEIKNNAILIMRESGESIICRYSGSAAKQTSETTYWCDDDTGPQCDNINGFFLNPGIDYKLKKSGWEVIFCDTDETWC